MKNITAFVIAGLLCRAAAGAAPAISGQAVFPPDASGAVAVGYDLDSPAIVTCEFLVNGTPVGGEDLCSVYGDVNRVVQGGAGRRLVWRPVEVDIASTDVVTARLRAWPLDNPPDWMAVDLTSKKTRRYYLTAAHVPYGVTNYLYKTDILLMRRIPARGVSWRMGQPDGGENCQSAGTSGHTKADILNNETGHMVTLTNDYYAGVYEVTRRQCQRIFGGKVSDYGDWTSFDTNACPENTKFSYNDLRGAPNATFLGWPRSGHAVKSGSKLDTLRTFTGLVSLDLPTEAEWEYACRAGTGSALNSGKECSNPGSGQVDGNMAEVGWMQFNEPFKKQTHAVGEKIPNNWGLYDCHGNVAEMCLDWRATGDAYRATFATGWEDGATTVAPVGPDNADGSLSQRVARGGSYFYGSSWARSASRRQAVTPGTAEYHFGFRLFCRIDDEANAE